MPDEGLLNRLAGHQRRFRIAAMAVAFVVGAAAAGVVLGLAAMSSAAGISVRLTAVAALIVVAGFGMVRAWRRWSLSAVAEAIEKRVPMDNLVVTAEEAASGRREIRYDAIRQEVFSAASDRLARVAPRAVLPLRRPIAAATLAAVAITALLIVIPGSPRLNATTAERTGAQESTLLAPGDIRVVVTPPAYAQLEATETVNPTAITALEGSEIRLEVGSDATRRVLLLEPDGGQTLFEEEALPNGRSGSRAVLTLPATSSRPLLIRQADANGETTDRLMHLRVQPDERPAVSIRQPAKDLIFPTPAGNVPIEIDARDDVGIQSLALRYTRVSGSGETFTFEEGEWPIEIVREGRASWRARAQFSLDKLTLQDGDTLVYRAVARDAKPGSDPSSSDTYLIEIGRLAGVASQGFAVPEERDRQAISQQMLIIKTERLHADRSKMTREAFAEQAQLLAVEQRMVKAEFVFMTGGEVEDEIEEATHAHELAEGRMENAAQVELLAAIREMSRAEARLNAADTAQALQFERAALAALQRAFDRRRYLLRTLPERTRIDVSRRLTGELDNARSSALTTGSVSTDSVVQAAQTLLRELSAPAASAQSLSTLAARMLALDPQSETLQAAAIGLTHAVGDARRDAVAEAQRALVDLLRARMPAQVASPLTAEPLKGRLVQELSRGGERR